MLAHHQTVAQSASYTVNALVTRLASTKNAVTLALSKALALILACFSWIHVYYAPGSGHLPVLIYICLFADPMQPCTAYLNPDVRAKENALARRKACATH